MTLDTMILLSGMFVAIAPFMGLPPAVYGWLYALVGMIIIGLGVAVRRNAYKRREDARIEALKQ